MLTAALPQDSEASRPPCRIVWQQRYDGIANVAYRGGKAIGGISGPWSNHYVLTWWEPMPGGQLEIFDTLEAAKLAVEQRAQSESSGNLTRSVSSRASRPARVSWLGRVRSLLPQRHRERARHCVSGTIEQMRQSYLRQDTDLSGLHLRACREI